MLQYGKSEKLFWEASEMLQVTAWFLFGFFTQLIAIIMWGEYVWLYKMAHGGVGGTPLAEIQPIFWLLLGIEIVVFGLFVVMRRRVNKLFYVRS